MNIYFEKGCFKRIIELLFNRESYEQQWKNNSISDYTNEDAQYLLDVLRNQELCLCFDYPELEQIDSESTDNVQAYRKKFAILLDIDEEKADYFIKLITLPNRLRFTKNCRLPSKPNSDSTIEERLKFYSSVLFVDSRTSLDLSLYEGMIVKESGDIEETLRHLKITPSNDFWGSLPSCTFYTQNKHWKDLINDKLPCSDIIIVDPYFFEADDNDSSLKLLGKYISNNIKSNVVIFCKPPKIRISKNKESITSTNYYEIYCNLKKKYEFVNFTFVQHHFSKEEKEKHLGIHDRYIITNYRLYLSGHSFGMYYNRREKFSANGGVWFNANSIMENNNYMVICYCIKEHLSKVLSCCEKGDVWGDIKSNLLDFQQGSFFQEISNRLLFEGKKVSVSDITEINKQDGTHIYRLTFRKESKCCYYDNDKRTMIDSSFHLCDIREDGTSFIAHNAYYFPTKES